MQIRNMPRDERPQEKLLYNGVNKMSNSELLALIIRTGTSEKSAIQLAEDVISYSCSSIGDLGTADVKELMEFDGIGVSKACSIVASVELAKRMISDPGPQKSKIIRDSSDVANLLMQEMKYEKRELLVELLLNVKGEIESKHIVSIGELAATNVHPREVFSVAIKKGAAAVIIAHNHPSGDPTPSDDDIIATKRIYEAGKVLGINLVDHVIIGDGEFVSLRMEGIIPDV